MDEKLKKELILKAKNLYGKVYPCTNKKNLDECFTKLEDESIVFWFNSEDNSTHMISEKDIKMFDIIKNKKRKEPEN